jgi:putative protease
VNAWFEGAYTQEQIDQWNERLSKVYNRGFWDGYYLGRKTGEWTEEYGNQATVRKMYVGKVTNYYSNIQVAEIKIETNSLVLDDEIKIIGPTTGVYEDVVSEIRVDLKTVDEAVKGDICSVHVKELVRRGDKLYKIVPADRNVPNLVQQ